MPADLAAVQADDALLDMLGSAHPTPGGTDDELMRLMAAWHHEIHADSTRPLVDTDTALAVIGAARRPTRRRNPVFGTAAAVAAVLVIAFSAVGLVAKSAQPGDQLWGLTRTLYSDYARSVEAAALVRTELDEVKTAIRQGKREQAKASLQRIQQQLPVIAEAEGRTDLTAQHHDLQQKLVEQPSVPREGSSTESPGSGLPAVSPAQLPATTPSSTSTTTEPNPLAGRESTTQPHPTATFIAPAEPTKPPSTPLGPDETSDPRLEPSAKPTNPGSSSTFPDSSGGDTPGSVPGGESGFPPPGEEGWQPGP